MSERITVRWIDIVIFAVMILVVLLGGYWFYQVELEQLDRDAQEDLSAIAQLKVGQIAEWRAELISDATLVMNDQSLAQAFLRWEESADPEGQELLLQELAVFRSHHQYYDLVLADANAQPRLSLSGQVVELDDAAQEAIVQAMSSAQPVLTDLHLDPRNGRSHLAAVAPLVLGATGDKAVGESAGVLVLQVDPERYLYPLVQQWPLPSDSAETLLVRADGQDVLFLNALRFSPGAALSLRIGMDDADLPAVMAISGVEGIVTGRDYRGVSVLASLSHVPDSDWYMVSKVDQDEVYADWRQRSALILIVVILSLLAIVALFGLSLQRRHRESERAMVRAAEDVYVREQRLRATLLSVGDAVIATDAQGAIEIMNPVAEALTGWSTEEGWGRTLDEVMPLVDEISAESLKNPASSALASGEPVAMANHTLLMTRDGRRVPIADSAAPIVAGDGSIVGAVLVFRDQTEQRAARRALEESERRLRAIFEFLPVGLWFADKTGKLTMGNPAGMRIWGAEPHVGLEEYGVLSARRLPSGEPIAPDDWALGYSLNEGVVVTDELLEIDGFDGKTRRILNYTAPIRDQDDEILGAVMVNLDVSERMAAEEQLVESEARFRSYVDHSPHGIFVADDQGVYVEVNQAASDITGYSAEELVGKRIDELIPADGQEDAFASFQRVVGQGYDDSEHDFLTKQGERRRWRVVAVRLSPERLLGFVTDITEHARADSTVRRRGAVNAALAEIASHLLMTPNPGDDLPALIAQAARRLTESEQAFCCVLSHDGQRCDLTAIESDAVGDQMSAFIYRTASLEPCADGTFPQGLWFHSLNTGHAFMADDPDTHPARAQDAARRVPVSNLLAAPVLVEGEVRGQLLVADSSRPYDAEDRDAVVRLAQLYGLFLRQSDLQRDLDEQAHRLRQADKMQAVGRLAGGVAHDFNNMLQVIIGYGEMALAEAAPDDPQHLFLSEIIHAGERSADLTRQLLAFARKQTIQPIPLDLNEAVAGMLKMLGRLVSEDTTITWNPTAESCPVWMDPSQIDQILANLVVNASDAIDGVGKIHIATERATLGKEDCQGTESTPGDYVLLSVSDTGVGMDRETLAKLFEPFFTTKGLGQGSGLGLATVYGIVRQNGGTINVYSELGMGTTFRIYIPLRESDREGAEQPLHDDTLPVGHQTILLVEDEEGVRRLAERMLTDLGYSVLAAPTPSEGLKAASEHRGPIDLVVTDVVMPQMNGRQLVERLQEEFPSLRYLYMSGYPAEVIADQGIVSGEVPFLAKPFTRAQLAQRVSEALGSS